MSESKTPRTDAAIGQLVVGKLELVDADFARTLELELNEAKKTLPLNSKLRLIDLVRYTRSPLHQEELITDEEYAELCSITESPKRLVEYDQLRSQLTTAQQEIAELRKREAVHNQWAASGQMVAKDYFADLEKDKERLDWLENNGVEIGISALAYHEISATRFAIDKGMREIQTRDSAMKGTKE